MDYNVDHYTANELYKIIEVDQENATKDDIQKKVTDWKKKIKLKKKKTK